jgi:deoxycytidylate deaminase
MTKSGLIIGLTGSFGAGCTTTSNLLIDGKGFTGFSLSDPIKEKARKQYKDFDKKKNKEKRKILQDIGDELRKKDLAFLAKPIIESIKKKGPKNIVIDSIKNKEEVNAFRDSFSNFFLLAIDAEEEIRWGRLKHDIYEGDEEAFKRDDQRDAGYDEPKHGQHVKECMDSADILINSDDNFIKRKKKDNKAIDEYVDKLIDFVNLMQYPGSRKPNLKELYIHQACSIALRSYCLKRQVGAIIVHEKKLNSEKKANLKKDNNLEKGLESYVVATGCNNVPINELDCELKFQDEPIKCYRERIKDKYFKEYSYCRKCGVGLTSGNFLCSDCKLDNTKLPGKLLDLCRAVHAEEAAILQAAKLGSSSLDGAKLYSSALPCMLCCKAIINSGIKNVVYLESYPMQESLTLDMFRKCNVEVSKFEGVNSIAFHKLFKKK